MQNITQLINNSDNAEKNTIDKNRLSASRCLIQLLEAKYGSNPKPDTIENRITDPCQLTSIIKDTAKWYGANLVGTTKMDITLFRHKAKDKWAEHVPTNYDNVIVLVYKMEAVHIKAAPSYIAGMETGLGYSKMAYTTNLVAELIRSFGYGAIPFGNGTAISPALAVNAGLGKLGRHGMLITDEYGPCVRISKIFTEAPLEVHKRPKELLHDFCYHCFECAKNCPGNAIGFNNNPELIDEVEKWPFDKKLCNPYFAQDGHGCSICIARCPLTK